MNDSSTCELTLKRNKTNFKKIKISSSLDASKYARQFYGDDLTIYESVFLILLNNQNETIGFAKISQGGVGSSIIDAKILLKFCIESLASSCILVHNHPSGTLIPSVADKKITTKIQNAVKFFDSKLLDHIILTEDAYYSFGDEGVL